MPKERRSLQDLIRSRQQSNFFGRQGQVVQYQENLCFPVDDERRRFLFNIHGDAGVGKTYLTKQLRQATIDNGCLTAYIDETIDDVISAMTTIAEEFSRGGARLSEFEKRAAAYREHRHKLDADPHVPDGVATFLTKTAITIGLAAARDVPIAGSLFAPLDVGATADQVNRTRIYLARKFSDYADVRLLLSPADELTPVFISGMERAAAGRPIALFIDTYERIGPVVDRWLHRLYDGQYGDLPETLITTISGQKPLNPNLWGDYLPVIADIPLEPFSEAEARQFLASKNIHDERTTQVILTLSGGLPMWLATLAEARPTDVADIGDPAGDAVDRFLKWEDDPARRNIALIGALPRTLNQDVLAAVAPSDTACKLFDWLCGLPFVTRRAGSWEYHEVVRAAMLRLQLARTPSEWQSNHDTLAQAHGRWARNAAAGIGNAWTNHIWIDHTREQFYHLLCADPINNLPKALASAVRAGEHSTIRARQWADVIADAGRDANNGAILKWGQDLAEGIRDSDLTRYLTCLINDANLDKSTLTIALKERAEDNRLAKRYDEALADYARAIELDPGNAWVIIGRGVTYRLAERYDEALADYARAIELDPGNAWIIIGRGVTHQLAERYNEALTDYSRVIELDPSNALAIIGRGETYRLMGSYDEALADYNRAIEVDPAALIGRGETYRLMGSYGEALADYSRALELDPGNVWAITGRGASYRLMGRYHEAIADYNRAIEMDPNNARAIIGRGETYRLMGSYDKALTDYNRGVELDPNNAWAIASRGLAYGLIWRYDEAVADFTRGIESDPNNARAIIGRGETYRLMGRYREAITDYNHAIELDPNNAWVIIGRGEAYRLMGRYDEAVADLTRGIKLNPNNDWATYCRGEAYRLMDRYREAITDYNHAIEMDPNNARAIASRGETYRLMGRYDEALADLTHAIEMDPNNAWDLAGRGETYRLMGRYDEALADLTHAIEMDPNNAWDLASRGETYRLMGRHDEALADYRSAIELDPTNSRALIGRSETYRLIRSYDEALTSYGRSVEFDPSEALAIASRDEARRQVGRRHDEAPTDYDRADQLIHSNSYPAHSPLPTLYDEAFTDYDGGTGSNPSNRPSKGFTLSKRRRRAPKPPANSS